MKVKTSLLAKCNYCRSVIFLLLSFPWHVIDLSHIIWVLVYHHVGRSAIIFRAVVELLPQHPMWPGDRGPSKDQEQRHPLMLGGPPGSLLHGRLWDIHRLCSGWKQECATVHITDNLFLLTAGTETVTAPGYPCSYSAGPASLQVLPPSPLV